MNEEAQLDKQILAASLYDPEAIGIFSEFLNPDAVGKPVQAYGYFQLYSDIVKCHKEIGEVTPDIFGAWLDNYPAVLDQLGGKKSYNELVKSLDGVEKINPTSLLKLAHKRLGRTQTIKKMEELKQALGDDGADDDSLEALSMEIQDRIRSARPEHKLVIRTATNIAEDAEALWDFQPFIPTQYKGLNASLGYDRDSGGVMRGNIYSIVATSGLGKSTLVKSMCNHWLDTGYKVLFINFEEAQDHWERILMTQITENNAYKKIASDEAARMTKKFKSKMNEWGDRFMIRHDPDSLYYEDLEHWLKEIYDNHEDKRPDIVVIDTIQSLFTKSGGKARWGEFEYIMVRLEKLAKEMNAVFILTAQQNSNALKESRTEINQSDIGGSVTIVQKSSVVIVLVPRKDNVDLDSFGSEGISDIIELHMPKNRITGTSAKKNPPLVKYDDEKKLYSDWSLAQDSKYSKQFEQTLDLDQISTTIGIGI